MKWLFLLRAFFPSWRFFDDSGPELVLLTRHRRGTQWSDWTGAIPPVPRGWRSFPLNARAGFLHACRNSIEHLAVDLNDGAQDAESRASFKIVKALALFQIRVSHGLPEAFQFKILLKAPDTAAEEFLLSPEYQV